MQKFLSEFEYNNIKIEVEYYCKYYDIKNKDFNLDFIFTSVLFAYTEYKDKVDYINNDKVICAVIKTITKRTICKYIFGKNVNYDTKNITENYSNYEDGFKIYNKKYISKILNTIFSSLNEKEQALFELLSQNYITKHEACKLLKIDKSFYDNFIDKLKRIINKYI